jgi:predicted transcriptional regulator
MPAKPILNVRLAPETLRKLDAVAAATRRTRSFIANEALEAWVNREIEIIEDLRVGLEEVRAGKGIPHERVTRDIDLAVERAIKRNGRRRASRK